jgi:NitT/TauT family transport system permease protein
MSVQDRRLPPPASLARRRAPRLSGGFVRASQSRTLSQLVVLLLLAVAWEIIGRAATSPLLPPLSAVLSAWVDLFHSGRFADNVGLTFVTFLMGFTAALVVGVLVGVAMGRFATVEQVLNPYINTFMSVPISGLIPVLLLVLGLGTTTRVVVVFLFAVWVIIVGTLTGIKNADAALIEMVRSFSGDERAILTSVAIPAALPFILGGIRIGIGRAVSGALIAEILTTLAGLGGLLAYYGSAFLTASVYAIVLTVTLSGFVLTEAVFRLERRLGHWRQL